MHRIWSRDTLVFGMTTEGWSNTLALVLSSCFNILFYTTHLTVTIATVCQKCCQVMKKKKVWKQHVEGWRDGPVVKRTQVWFLAPTWFTAICNSSPKGFFGGLYENSSHVLICFSAWSCLRKIRGCALVGGDVSLGEGLETSNAHSLHSQHLSSSCLWIRMGSSQLLL